MKSFTVLTGTVLAGVLAGATLAHSATAADSVADFYGKHGIALYIGYTPGGG